MTSINTISGIICNNIRNNPDKPFLIKVNSSVQTYSELANLAEIIKNKIPENIVAGILISSPSMIMPTILACWSKNTIPAILEPQIKYEKFKIIKEITGLQLIVTDQKLEDSFSTEKTVNLGDGGSNSIRLQKSSDNFSIHIPDDSPALLLFTSGSTGIPKCVPLSLSNIWSNVKRFSEILNIDENNVFLSTSPLFYAHALYNSFLTALLLGTTVIYNGVLNIMNVANAVKLANRHNATVYNLTPSMMQILIMMAGKLKEPFPKFRHIICGTAKLEPDLKKKFETAFNCIVTQQYGMTETLFISVNSGKQIESPESVGIPVACEIRITDDNGTPLQKDQKGDISVKSESSFGSYFKQTEETNTSYIDGWFFTGDEGKIDDDGYLTVTGRKKEIIKKGGYNINPNEINAVLNKFDAISDSATISMPDPVYGEEIYSFVAGNALSEAIILDFCYERLPKTHIPKKIFIISKIPKTSNGKTDLQELRRLAKEKI